MNRGAQSPSGPTFGPRGELRQSFGRDGRVHIDRWLPFLVTHRAVDPRNSIARRVAINSPAYLIWSPDDDGPAERMFAAVAGAVHDRFGAMLVIAVEDAAWTPPEEGSQALPPFIIRVGGSAGAGARRALECLAGALAEVEIDLRRAEVEIGDMVETAIDVDAGAPPVDRLSMVIPQIHRAGETTYYPQLTRELAGDCGDALLRAACAFIEERRAGAPAHYRSLGRSAFLAAALDADRRLDQVARSFEFLLSVSPINSVEAMQHFFDRGEQSAPQFRYRPLTVDPDAAKGELYAVDLSLVEDPLLERLLSEKRQEIDHQLTMLATRNTPAFKAASQLHYGTVDALLLADARDVLAAPRPAAAPGSRIGADEIARAARALVARYQAVDPRFDPRIEIRADVGSLLVSGGALMIPSNTSMLEARADPLLAHEVSVHLLTFFNGATQGLTVFRTGLAHYEGLQEGLGVFAEWATGGLTTVRLRHLAGRVLAVNAMLDGAEFVELFRMLVDDHGLARRSAFDITARVCRSGGFAKDFIYLKGFRGVIGAVAAGASLAPFWIGKISPDHVPAIEELLQRKLVRPPLFTPEFLDREDVRRRIARLRDGLPFDRILQVE